MSAVADGLILIITILKDTDLHCFLWTKKGLGVYFQYSVHTKNGETKLTLNGWKWHYTVHLLLMYGYILLINESDNLL